jgi:hypothetical protein
MIGSVDPDATESALEKALASPAFGAGSTMASSYDGVDYFVAADGASAVAVIDDFLVIGGEISLRAIVDASEGSSLGDSDAYQHAVQGLTEDRLATFYVDAVKALQATPGAAAALPGGLGGPFGDMAQPAASIVYARSDALVFEASSSGSPAALSPASGTDLIERLPGDSWAAFGAPDFGRTLEQFLTILAGAMPGAAPGGGTEVFESEFEVQFGLSLREDLLSWIGDIALFAEGTQLRSLGGGFVIEALDPAKAAQALPKIRAALDRGGAPVKPLGLDGFEGFSLQDRSMPQSINVVAADDRVLVVYGRAATLAALGADPSLGGTEGYAAAQAGLGDGFSVSGYLDIAPVLDLIRSASGADPAYENGVKPFLTPLSYVVFGTRVDGDRVVARVVIGVE